MISTLKIRLFISFLILSIAPLILVGFFTFTQSRSAVINRVVNQLEAVAQVQESRIHETIDRYLEQTKLVTSRTQLRESLFEYNNTGNEIDRERILSIINDARSSVRVIEVVSILDLSGVIIQSTDQSLVGEIKPDAQSFRVGLRTTALIDIYKDVKGFTRVLLVGPLVLDGKVIGTVEILANPAPIVEITEDYTGLGSTGEAIFAKNNTLGDALFLTPLRFDAGAALNLAVQKENKEIPIITALERKEVNFTDNKTVDYRGAPIFAVTRYIDAVDWGLVVKIDREEALRDVAQLLQIYGLIILFFIILVAIIAYIAAKKITKPILILTKATEHFKKGDFDVKAVVNSNDEFGFLAEAFNQMAVKLSSYYKDLEQKVKDRTRDLMKEKKKDEAILSNIGEGLVVTDVQRKVILINKVGLEMIGQSYGSVIGKKWPELLRNQKVKLDVVDEAGKNILRPDLPIVRALDLKQTVSSRDYKLMVASGESIPVAITASPLLFENETAGAIVVFRDISEEKSIDKAKSEFVSLASHQLRTPLSTINWYSEMLLAGDAGKLTREQKKYLDEIYTGNQRMVALVNALLNVSRIELGTFSVEPVELNVVELAKEVVKVVEPNLFKRKIGLTEYYEKKTILIFADPKLLTIVIENLLTNAIKYSPEKTKMELNISEANEEVVISVKDQGFGIPKDQQAKIFSKLFRADNVRAKETDGTGLGLYITKSIVEHSGGKIEFVSVEDKGSTFTVTLPVKGMKKKQGSKRIE